MVHLISIKILSPFAVVSMVVFLKSVAFLVFHLKIVATIGKWIVETFDIDNFQIFKLNDFSNL
jgi:hypothetical protein